MKERNHTMMLITGIVLGFAIYGVIDANLIPQPCMFERIWIFWTGHPADLPGRPSSQTVADALTSNWKAQREYGIIPMKLWFEARDYIKGDHHEQ